MADGHFNKCKECQKEDIKKNRDAKLEYYREYDKRRFQEDPRVKERHRKYQTGKGKEKHNKAKRKYIENNPEKRAAHVILGNAIRSGRVVKPDRCKDCGKDCSGKRQLHAHHEDYAYPLSVNWLCPLCHKKLHQQLNENQNGTGLPLSGS